MRLVLLVVAVLCFAVAVLLGLFGGAFLVDAI